MQGSKKNRLVTNPAWLSLADLLQHTQRMELLFAKNTGYVSGDDLTCSRMKTWLRTKIIQTTNKPLSTSALKSTEMCGHLRCCGHGSKNVTHVQTPTSLPLCPKNTVNRTRTRCEDHLNDHQYITTMQMRRRNTKTTRAVTAHHDLYAIEGPWMGTRESRLLPPSNNQLPHSVNHLLSTGVI